MQVWGEEHLPLLSPDALHHYYISENPEAELFRLKCHLCSCLCHQVLSWTNQTPPPRAPSPEPCPRHQVSEVSHISEHESVFVLNSFLLKPWKWSIPSWGNEFGSSSVCVPVLLDIEQWQLTVNFQIWHQFCHFWWIMFNDLKRSLKVVAHLSSYPMRDHQRNIWKKEIYLN